MIGEISQGEYYIFVIFFSSTFSPYSLSISSSQYFSLPIGLIFNLLFNLELSMVITTLRTKSMSKEKVEKKKKQVKESSKIYYVPGTFQVLSGGFWEHSYILCSLVSFQVQYGFHLAVEKTETRGDYNLSKDTKRVGASAEISLHLPGQQNPSVVQGTIPWRKWFQPSSGINPDESMPIRQTPFPLPMLDFRGVSVTQFWPMRYLKKFAERFLEKKKASCS